ncbi:small integral membrane protein 29-like [Erpetoichthys calabaricus]|uniref:small integral membrane protein 29-like n=1 Tax=Erpetoichthys calabaricus TaxID=27687 RepID=UPI00109F6E23|nr:small integral membrane protein 29-like [Erpetoichthys calabaricus]
MNNKTTTDTVLAKPSYRATIHYILIVAIAVLTLGILLILVIYFRKRKRLDQLRHKLIPVYTYDPSEDYGDDLDSTDEELMDEQQFNGRLLLRNSIST